MKEKEKNTPIVSQMEVLARNIGFVPSRSDSHSPEEGKPICPQPKQHNGLRCKKCFELLVRDDEFLFAGGLLLVNPIVLVKRGWKGLHEKGGVVFCKNMHNVGRLARATYANQGIPFYRLRGEKTTWEANYINNPQFKDSEITKNKPIGITRPLMPCELEELRRNESTRS